MGPDTTNYTYTGPLIIGFDSEWVYRPETQRNHVLSYQFAGRSADGAWSGIIYTEGPEQKNRLRLRDLMGRAIEAGLSQGPLTQWPTELYACAHFTRADLSTFQDFAAIGAEFDSVRGSYTTTGNRPYRCRYNDRNRNAHDLTIKLRDTAHLTPGGGSLEELGKLHGLEKIKLPDGMVAHMDQLLEKDPGLYEQYAIRDAEISALHLCYMTDFAAANELRTDPPTTLSGLGQSLLLRLWDTEQIDLATSLGKEVVEEQIFNRHSGTFRRRRSTVPIASVHDNELLATESFHGGRNEAFLFGFTPLDFWYDLDLSAAYSTALAAIREVNWNDLEHTKDVSRFKAKELGLARIRFRFPEDFRYPTIPVRTSNGLIFPLEGESYVASPEIQLAVELGADVQILSGFVIPWAGERRLFERFSHEVRQRRSNLEKGSIDERIWKELGNSVYGRLAQGLREKRVYDSRAGQGRVMPQSKITQPYLAAYTTSLIRAVVGELLNAIPATHNVVSVTTDGFITNLPPEQIPVNGSLCKMFAELSLLMHGSKNFVELKHVVPSVLCFKTRGQLTVGVLSENLRPVTAKAGLTKPEIQALETGLPVDHLENDYMLKLFLERDSTTTISTKEFVSMRAMSEQGLDLVSIDKNKRVNMEYDWKRELVDPRLEIVGRSFGTLPNQHLTLQSKPWKNVEEFQQCRSTFDEWRLKEDGVLKTEADWMRWSDYRVRRTLRQSGQLQGKGKLVDQAKRMFLKAYALGLWGLEGKNYAEAAERLTEAGYPTSENDLKNAKRSKVAPETLWQLAESDKDVRNFVSAIESLWNIHH